MRSDLKKRIDFPMGAASFILYYKCCLLSSSFIFILHYQRNNICTQESRGCRIPTPFSSLYFCISKILEFNWFFWNNTINISIKPFQSNEFSLKWYTLVCVIALSHNQRLILGLFDLSAITYLTFCAIFIYKFLLLAARVTVCQHESAVLKLAVS